MVISIDFSTVVQTAIANLLSGLIANIFYVLLFIWGVKMLSREIKVLSKEIPEWIEKYFQLRHQQLKVESALSRHVSGVPLNLDKRKIIPVKTK